MGITQLLPETDRHSHSKVYVSAMIAVKMGGRVAEELILGQITTGARDDLEKATELARKMVCEWGMSEDMGPLTFGRKEEQVFLGRDIAQHQDYSENTALKIDGEVQGIVKRNYQRAKGLLTKNRHLLVRVAETLLEREVLIADEVKMVVEGLPLKDRETESKKPTETAPEKKVESEDEERKAPIGPPILQNPKSIPQS